jgi:hypothetical protein
VVDANGTCTNHIIAVDRLPLLNEATQISEQLFKHILYNNMSKPEKRKKAPPPPPPVLEQHYGQPACTRSSFHPPFLLHTPYISSTIFWEDWTLPKTT